LSLLNQILKMKNFELPNEDELREEIEKLRIQSRKNNNR
jgi:hypothetical protein